MVETGVVVKVSFFPDFRKKSERKSSVNAMSVTVGRNYASR